MLTAGIKSSAGAKRIKCDSADVDLSMYDLEMNGELFTVLKDGKAIVKTDCLSRIEYPIGKEWEIHRRFNGKNIDKLFSSDGDLLLSIERDYRPEASSIFNNHLKIELTGESTPIVTKFAQWKLFFPIKVEAAFSSETNTDMLVISLLLAWFRYEYNSHDQMY